MHKETNMNQPKNLLEALICARKSCTAPYKDKVNPHHKSRYASLFAMIEAVEDACDDNSLLLETTWIREEGKWIGVQSILTFAPTGETKNTFCPVSDVEKMTPQQVGSAWTYARRYTILALFNLAPTDEKPQALDDDGEGLEKRKPPVAPRPVTRPSSDPQFEKTLTEAHQKLSSDQFRAQSKQRFQIVCDFVRSWIGSYPDDLEVFASAYITYHPGNPPCTAKTLPYFKGDQWIDLEAGMRKFERDHT